MQRSDHSMITDTNPFSVTEIFCLLSTKQLMCPEQALVFCFGMLNFFRPLRQDPGTWQQPNPEQSGICDFDSDL